MRRLVMAAVIAAVPLAGSIGPAHALQLFPNGLFGKHQKASTPEQPTVHLAQSTEAATVTQLQEEVRTLNGRIEELSYQLLQMQEQLRKYQEDNEFRFQELEGGGTKKSGSLDKPVDAGQQQDDVASLINQPDAQDQTNPDLGVTEQNLGSIELDANGMPVGSTLNEGAVKSDRAANSGESLPGVDTGPQAQTASLSSESDIYQAAYSHVLSGDYSVAEKEFQQFIKEYPSSKKIADANFWLGEAQYSQGDFNDAAKTFLNAHQTYGSSPKAPEMLLKLGMSLAQLDNKDTACAIYTEFGKRYPKASRAVANKVSQEQKRLAC